MFDGASYAELLARIAAAGYRFARVDRTNGLAPGDKVLMLRHDVDISPAMAGRLGEIASAAGVGASFFFQLNAETYNVFSDETRGIIAALRGAGHCVGLHFDETLTPPDEALVNRTLDWFGACVAEIDRAVSFHRPTPDVLGRDFAGFQNAYAAPLFSEEGYFSDSRRDAGFVKRLDAALAEGRGPLQLLLHPEWWCGIDDMAELADAIAGRRRSELDRYLLRNFNRVFGEHVSVEDGDPRV